MSFSLFTADLLKLSSLQDQCKQFSDGVKALLEDYNKTVSFLLVLWA